MIYTATRRRSAVESVLGMIGPLVMASAAWLAVLTTDLIPRDVNLLVLAVWVWLALVFCIVTHELGHLVVGLIVGRPVRKILIGRGATLYTARPGGIRVQVCSNLIGGGAVYFSAVDPTPTPANIAVSAAGPAVNILTGLLSLALLRLGWPWLGTLGVTALLLGAGNAIPSRYTSGGREHFSDGMQILRRLQGRSGPPTFFEGENLTSDGERITIRAIEEASDSESEQVTERHLLAALDREPDIHGLLASARVADLTRFPGPPNSLDVRASRSPVVEQVYRFAFRIARDLGVPRPNAACLCLALMSVPSDVATRLNEAVDQTALRALATRRTEASAPAEPPVVLADLPLERWGSAADRVLALAQRISAVDRSVDTGTQHLIAAMVAERQCRAAEALGSVGFVLHRNDRAVSPGEPAAKAGPLTPEAQTAIAAALLRTGATYACGTGELLLGVADQPRSMSAALFTSCDISGSALQAAVVSAPREQSEPTGVTPAIRQMWEVRARARVGAERYLDAREDYLVLVKSAPSEQSLAVQQNNVAWASLLSGDRSLFADALERSRAAVAVMKDQPSIQGTYALALLEAGELTQAVEILESVIPRQPRPRDRANALCMLAMCRARLGDGDAAKAHVAAAEQTDPRCALLARARAEVAGSPILR